MVDAQHVVDMHAGVSSSSNPYNLGSAKINLHGADRSSLSLSDLTSVDYSLLYQTPDFSLWKLAPFSIQMES